LPVPLVSILIPCFNAVRYLGKTIESAQAQSWERTETIVVDDGSTDGSLELARQFESSLVKVIHQENRGACCARNRAYEEAQGDYIQWLDADDLLHPEKINLQIDAVRMLGLEERTLLTGPFGQFLNRPWKSKFRPTPLWQDLKPVDWIINKFYSYTWMNPATWLLSRQLVEAAGPWDETLARDQDGEYICRVISRANFVKFVKRATSYYRQSGRLSVSNSFSRKAYESIWRSIRLCVRYLLDLEDSRRSRDACVTYLRTWYPHFYPDHPDLMKEIRILVERLGGTVPVPEIRRKYRLISKIVGESRAKRASRVFPLLRHDIWREFDRIAARLSVEKPLGTCSDVWVGEDS